MEEWLKSNRNLKVLNLNPDEYKVKLDDSQVYIPVDKQPKIQAKSFPLVDLPVLNDNQFAPNP